MKLSVIIPIYNVEKYIEECLNSLLQSKEECVEFILVDDGSTDSSVAIAKEIMSKDSRFKLFHKTNGGLSDARNYGVSRCTGDYVFYLDSDDTIAQGMLEEVCQTLDNEHPDLLVFDMLFVWENTEQTKRVLGMNPNEKDRKKSLLLSTPSACNKIIRRELAEAYPFPYGMYYEDLATIPMLYTEVSKVIYIDKPYYHYRQREGSIIYTFNEKTLDVFKCFDRIFHHYQDCSQFDACRNELEYLAIEHLMLYANRRFINSSEADKYLALSKKYMNEWFKNWKKNHYMRLMSLNDRMFIQVASTGNAVLLKAMLKIKHIMKGKGR